MSRHMPSEHRDDGLVGEVIQATERAEATLVADASAQWTPGRFRWANALSAVVVTAFGATIWFASGSYALWVGGLPGPGFFPGIVGFCLTALGVLYLIGSLARRYPLHDEVEPPPDRRALVTSALSVAIMGLTAFVLVPIGYPIVAALGVALLVRLAGGSWRTAVVSGVLFAAATFLLVTTALGIQLPTGVLGPLLTGLL